MASVAARRRPRRERADTLNLGLALAGTGVPPKRCPRSRPSANPPATAQGDARKGSPGEGQSCGAPSFPKRFQAIRRGGRGVRVTVTPIPYHIGQMRKPKSSFPRVAAACGLGLGFLFLRHSAQARADALLHAAARNMLESIAAVMGCQVPPLRLSRAVMNAQADGVGVTVNPDWLHTQMTSICSDVRCHHDLLVGILAHELAHLVYGDVHAPPWDKRAIELRADQFAGMALARLGVSPDAFSTVIGQLSTHYSDDPTAYPDGADRIDAIESGYYGEVQHQFLTVQYQAGRLAALRYYGLVA
jgi:hypothetical protein